MKWTEEKLTTLKKWYGKKDTEELAKELGTTKEALWIRAGLLGISRGPGTEWTKEKLEVLKKWYKTLGPEKLAERFGVTVAAVKLKASRIGASRKIGKTKFKWTDEAVQAIKERYKTEEISVLCKDLNASVGCIRNKAVSLGLHSNVGKVRAGRQRAENNTSVNIHYFDHWSPNMAYIFGFLLADGSINKRATDVVIGIAVQDIGILEFIKEEMQSTRPFYYREGHKDSQGNQHQQAVFLILGSQVMVRRLQELGMQRRKTYTDEPFPDVPDEFMADFIRGYFDGDGHVLVYRDKRWPSNSRCRIGLVGSPRFADGLRDVLVRLAGMGDSPVNLEKTCQTPTCKVYWSAKADLRRFHGFVYPAGHGFCLERKKQRLVGWLRNQEERG